MNIHKFDTSKISDKIKALLPQEEGSVLVIQYNGIKAIEAQLDNYPPKTTETALFVALPNKCAVAYVFDHRNISVYNNHALRNGMAYVRTIADKGYFSLYETEEMQEALIIDAARALKSLLQLNDLFGKTL